jgi:glycosyltransferase involved in cell wall biosynthesis
MSELERRTGEQERRLTRLERAESVPAVMAWVDQARLASSPLVSVILPTRNRSAQLPRALSSVIDQTYPHWELVVVDDASDDDTPGVVASFPDPRIRYHRVAQGGVCAARNHGLAEARGELVAYLDDDNTMHPGWLKTVVWGFEQHPEADAAYGAFLIDDPTRVNGPGSGSPPTLFLHPYDRGTLLRNNLADISAIAHRAGLSEAHFDEGLREMGDWDLLVRITAHRDPLVLPAIACFYATDAPNRLSNGPTFHRDWAEVLRKNGIDNQVSAP